MNIELELKQAMRKMNWFDTLNEALASERLVDFWPIGTNIEYGETLRVVVDTPLGDTLISVSRNQEGRYERPVHYLA